MPGQPIARRHCLILDAIGEAEVLEWRAAGDSWRQLCQHAADWARANGQEENLAGRSTLAITALDRWLKKAEGRRDRWDECNPLCAESKVGKAEELLEGSDPNSNASVQKAAKLADHLRWVAGKINRPEWGEDQQGGTVNVNLGDLHLIALRAAQRPAASLGEAVEVRQLNAGDSEED